MTSCPAPPHRPPAAWADYALVAAGSALGAAVRYLLVLAAGPWAGDVWATVAVNVLGCFAIGTAAGRMGRWWPLVGPGFLGGFTTFSAFVVMLDPAAGVVTLLACPLAAWLGTRVVRDAR